jgi:hypothetical protein
LYPKYSCAVFPPKIAFKAAPKVQPEPDPKVPELNKFPSLLTLNYCPV